MYLNNLKLINYRNFSEASFKFSNSTVILADNTFGKTNILEAIFYLATGKPFRTDKEIEVIKDNNEFLDLKGNVRVKDEEMSLRVFVGKNQPRMKKQLQINGVNRSLSGFSGNLKAVLFTPENFDILNGSPQIRRKYIDAILTQISREYAKSLSKYKRVVYQRNRLLERIQEGKSKRDELEYWDQNLLSLGRFIQEQRFQLFSFLNDKIDEYLFLYKSKKPLSFEYKSNIVSEERLLNYQDKEIGAGMTLIGPHRDDFITFLSDKEINAFGSRGEQRLGILSLCLIVLDFFEFHVKERPLLLLDDIFSELDSFHRETILDILNSQQTIITTTDWEFDSKGVTFIKLR